jgi:hypothetical protein
VQEAPVQPFGFEGALVCRNCFKTVVDDHGVPIGEAEAG